MPWNVIATGRGDGAAGHRWGERGGALGGLFVLTIIEYTKRLMQPVCVKSVTKDTVMCVAERVRVGGPCSCDDMVCVLRRLYLLEAKALGPLLLLVAPVLTE